MKPVQRSSIPVEGPRTAPILGADGLRHASFERRFVSTIISVQGSTGLLDRDFSESAQPKPLNIHSLSELLNSSGVGGREISHPFDRTTVKLGALLPMVQRYPPPNLSLLALDRYVVTNPVAAKHFVKIILALPPTPAAALLGREALTWACAHLHQNGFREHGALRQFLINAQVDPTLFEKAVRTTAHWLAPKHAHRAETMVINYALMGLHARSGFDPLIGIRELVSDNRFHIGPTDKEAARRGAFPMSRCGEYALKPILAEGYRDYGNAAPQYRIETVTPGGERKVYPNFIDAPLGFSLTWKGVPQATLSGLVSDPHTFFVVQVHGAQGHLVDKEGKEIRRLTSRGLIGLRWEELLLEVAQRYATGLGLQRLGLLGSSNNQWLGSERNQRRTFTFEQAAERYDSLAEKSGWSYSAQDQNWYRSLI